jgi:hypothetical protein
MPLFSTRTGTWASRGRRPLDTGPNPYDEGSKHHAERHRVTEIKFPGGLTRIDLGEPIRRHSTA